MKIKLLYFLILGFCLFSSCTKETEYILPKGTLSGRVKSNSDWHSLYQSRNLTHVKVTIERTNPLIEAETDSNGYFEIPNLDQGTYTLLFSKDGYYTLKKPGVNLIGSDTHGFIEALLSPKKGGKIKQTTLSQNDYGYSVILETENITDPYFHIYSSSNENVSYDDYEEMISYEADFNYIENFGPDRFKIYIPPFFNSGSTKYVRIYPNDGASSSYTNPLTGSEVYYGINTEGGSDVLVLNQN